MGGPEILVPLGFFAAIASVIVIPRYFKSKEREQMQSTIRAAIERGQPLPPELIEVMTRNVRPRPSSSSDLRAAIVWLAWGLGIAGFFVAGSYEWSNEMLPLAYIGAIPLFIGAAYLIMALLNAKKDKASA
jgi:hypothetical protein